MTLPWCTSQCISWFPSLVWWYCFQYLPWNVKVWKVPSATSSDFVNILHVVKCLFTAITPSSISFSFLAFWMTPSSVQGLLLMLFRRWSEGVKLKLKSAICTIALAIALKSFLFRWVEGHTQHHSSVTPGSVIEVTPGWLGRQSEMPGIEPGSAAAYKVNALSAVLSLHSYLVIFFSPLSFLWDIISCISEYILILTLCQGYVFYLIQRWLSF